MSQSSPKLVPVPIYPALNADRNVARRLEPSPLLTPHVNTNANRLPLSASYLVKDNSEQEYQMGNGESECAVWTLRVVLFLLCASAFLACEYTFSQLQYCPCHHMCCLGGIASIFSAFKYYRNMHIYRPGSVHRNRLDSIYSPIPYFFGSICMVHVLITLYCYFNLRPHEIFNYTNLFHTVARYKLAPLLGLVLVQFLITIELVTWSTVLLYSLSVDRKIYRKVQKAKIALVDQLDGLAISVKLA